MVRTAIDELSSNSRDLLQEALARISSPERLSFVNEHWDAPATRSVANGPSRQARHARFARALTAAVSGCMALAPGDERFARFILSSEFARLRPRRADVQIYSTQMNGSPLHSLDAARRMWELGEQHLLELRERELHGALPEADCLTMGAAVTCMFVGPCTYGPLFADPCARLLGLAIERGLLARPWLDLQLSLVAGMTGDPAPLASMLDGEKPAALASMLPDFLIYVRGDNSRDALECELALVKGDALAPEDCCLSTSPFSTVKRAAEYVSNSMRAACHFRSQGQVLMCLHLESQVRELASRMVKKLETSLPRSVTRAFEAIDRVEEIEKRRFWTVHDGCHDDRLRHLLEDLWKREGCAEIA